MFSVYDLAFAGTFFTVTGLEFKTVEKNRAFENALPYPRSGRYFARRRILYTMVQGWIKTEYHNLSGNKDPLQLLWSSRYQNLVSWQWQPNLKRFG